MIATTAGGWSRPVSPSLEEMWQMIAPLRSAPHVVLEVRRYAPDGIAIDWTAIEREMREGPFGSLLPEREGTQPGEQRYIISEGTFATMKESHPEWFGPFGVRVEWR